MKFIALLGALLLHDALACDGCGDAKHTVIQHKADKHEEKHYYRSDEDIRRNHGTAKFAAFTRAAFRKDDAAKDESAVYANRYIYRGDAKDAKQAEDATLNAAREDNAIIRSAFTANNAYRATDRAYSQRLDYARRDDRAAYRTDDAAIRTDDQRTYRENAYRNNEYRRADRYTAADRQIIADDDRRVRIIRAREDQPVRIEGYNPIASDRREARLNDQREYRLRRDDDYHEIHLDDRHDARIHPELQVNIRAIERRDDRPTAFENCVGEGCKARETLEAPTHRVQNFDIKDQHIEAKDFNIADANFKLQKLDNDDRKRENEERAKKVAAQLADFKQDAVKIKADKLEDARKLADDSDLASLKMKKVELPVVKATYEDAKYYQATIPTLAIPTLPRREEPTKPYIFDEKVCDTLDCKLAHKECADDKKKH